MKKAVIFDLDGTLLDTLEDLRDSLNYALEQRGHRRQSTEEVRRKVGDGLAKLVERALEGSGADTAERDAVLEEFKPYYAAHCREKTCPYAGVTELMEALKDQGVRIAIVSNKVDGAVKALSGEFFPGLVDFAAGEKEGVRRKPAPDTVLEALRALEAEAAEAVYVGDSEVDIATAENAGMEAILVTWGFRDEEFLITKGAKKIVHNAEELKDALSE